MIRGLLKAIIAASVLGGLGGCVMPQQLQATTTTQPVDYIGSLTPVYNPPPGTPFRCVDTGSDSDLYQVPGYRLSRIDSFTGPAATLGARRGDWLLIVTRTGLIGWVYLPHENPISESRYANHCSVHQDAQGRIVFHTSGGTGMF
jgi:hypothetical protein